MSIRIITPESMLSYPHLFKPQAPMEEGGKAKFSAVFVFGPDTDITDLKRAAIEAAKETYGDKAAGMIRSGKLRLPFRTDTEDKGYPDGSTFFAARSDTQPGIVSIYPGPDGRPLPITNEGDVYPGCIARASVSFYAYDRAGNKGVGVALNNVQKLRDGDRLDGRKKAQDEFDADLDAVAPLDDLTEEVEVEEAPVTKKGRGKAKDEDDLSDLLG